MKAHDDFRQGFIDGIPIGLAYVAVSFAFGIAGVSKGIPVWALTLISATCLTSAGQFAAIISMTTGGSLVELILSQIIINLRYSIMSIAIGQKLVERAKTWNRFTMAFGVTDEIFAVSCGRPGEITPKYFYALMTVPWVSWLLGTFLGATASELLPAIVRDALGLAIYGMLIGIIIPPAKTDRNIIIVIIISMTVSLMFRFVEALSFVSSGFVIIICTLIASVIGALFFPVKEDKDECR